MFNNRKDARPAAGNDAATTLIAAGTRVRGDVHFSGRLHLDGNVEGAIRGEGEQAMLTLSEHAVVTEALDVIASGEPKMLEFGVADETAWNVGLSCGGTIRVFVEKVG